jgi:hypothetical protein
MILFEEHHKWKFVTWLVGSSPYFPSKFGISESNFVGILDQVGSCKMGSFVSLVKSRILRYDKYEIGIFGGGLVPSIMCVGNGPIP